MKIRREEHMAGGNGHVIIKEKNFSIISLQYAYFTNNSFCGYSGL